MRIILKTLIFLSFAGSTLLTLYSLLSLSEFTLFGPRLFTMDSVFSFRLAIGLFVLGVILVYAKNKIAKKYNYFE